MQLWRTLRTKQIDVGFQMPLHCGMVWKSPPPFILPPPFRTLNSRGRISNGGGKKMGGWISKPNQPNIFKQEKSLAFVPGPFRILELVPFRDLAG